MDQPGYQTIDYAEKKYIDTIEELKQRHDQDFKIISRANALSKLVGKTTRYSVCWNTPALWFTFQEMALFTHVEHMFKPQFFTWKH